MVALNDRFAQLVITREGVMYLTRRIETGRFGADARDDTSIDAGALALESELKNETSLRVSTLDVRNLFSVAQSDEVVTDWHTLMALGAALREDKLEL